MTRTRMLAGAALGALLAASLAPAPAFALNKDCPNGGTVRFGVEPFESADKLTPVFQKVADLLAKKLDCKVQLFIATSYNAEIEAMRAGKLDIGELGPLGYVLAHQVAHAEAVAAYADDTTGKPSTYTAGIVTWPGSGITTLAQVKGHSFAFSDPASTSGNLFPSYALEKAGIDHEKGVKGIFAGSHTASFETIRNHKVDAGELNSSQIASATRAGSYKAADFPELWRSDPIPNDPIAIRGTLPAEFKARATKVMQSFDFSELGPDVVKEAGGGHWVPEKDSSYNGIRDLVKVLHVDLNKLE